LVSTAFVFFSAIFLFLYLQYNDNNYDVFINDVFLSTREAQAPASSLLSPEAYPVYGIFAEFDRKNGGTTKIPPTVSAVYAFPNGKSKHAQRADSSSTKGIVLLLHACTHSALKFFAPSPTCPDCIGLSEEMRIARTVLERGYAVVAVTASSKGGCWGGTNDLEGIKRVLEGFRNHLMVHNTDREDYQEMVHELMTDYADPTIYALGASSGGSMAAKLVANGIAESAAVMVTSLNNELLDGISSLPEPPGRKLYLAPMTRDKGTAHRVRRNYAYWMEEHSRSTHDVLLDETSCVPLPVTANYLWNRVPGMTLEAAEVIVEVLLEYKHLDPSTMKFIVDPTRSNWRDLFLQGDIPIPNSLRLSQQEQEEGEGNQENANKNKSFEETSSMMLWETFDLTPGISPLAKALHRAWAMHEYCSEIVELALDYFEGQKTKQDILEIIQPKYVPKIPK
jgi:alpha-beta hydrolase superfamily lysophospholipase